MDDEATSKLIISLCDFLKKVTMTPGLLLKDELPCLLPSLSLLKSLLNSSQSNRLIVAQVQGLVILMKLLNKNARKVESSNSCPQFIKAEIWGCINALIGGTKPKEKVEVISPEKIKDMKLSPSTLIKQLQQIKNIPASKPHKRIDGSFYVSIDVDAILEVDGSCRTSQYHDAKPEMDLPAESKCLLKGTLINVTSDLTHELRPTRYANQISSITLTKIATSMLNSGKGGTIYFGVNENRMIFGMKLSRDLRDSFRISIDSNFNHNIDPPVTHDMYNVCFIPVVEDESSLSTPICANHSLYAIVLTLKPRPNLFFLNDKSCYVRIGDTTQLASAQKIREKAIAIQEEICMAEIHSLKKEIEALELEKF